MNLKHNILAFVGKANKHSSLQATRSLQDCASKMLYKRWIANEKIKMKSFFGSA
jgi:hypothetical protein